MIRVTVSYPSAEGSTFNHDYYRNSHVPLVCKAWGISRFEIDKGVNGPNVAAVHLFLDSMDAVGAAMGSPATAEVMADVANYTNIAPVVQMSEVVE